MGSKYKPKIQCKLCSDIVVTTSIDCIIQKNIGCICRSSIPWRNRYDEFKNIMENNNNAILLYTEDEWKQELAQVLGKSIGKKQKPKIQCKLCQDIVVTTSIDNALLGRLGCKCRVGGIRAQEVALWIDDTLLQEPHLSHLRIETNVMIRIEERKYKLELDIVLYHKSTGEMVAVIEMDGEQHFHPVFYFGGSQLTDEQRHEKFMSQLRRDQAKDNHLSKQRVFLLRVAYTDYKTAKSHVYDFLDNVVSSSQLEYSTLYSDRQIYKKRKEMYGI